MKVKKVVNILNLDVKDRKFPEFRVGDTLQVNIFVKEAGKERIQPFKGCVIAKRNSGIASSFTVRTVGANNVGIERIFPYYSPIIDSIKVLKRGDVCRAKLFYLRKRVGKAAKVKEKVLTKSEKEQMKV